MRDELAKLIEDILEALRIPQFADWLARHLERWK